MTDWQDHLSALEALVVDARAALSRADDSLGAFSSSVSALTPPPEPLTSGDADRAGAVLGALHRLTDELGAAHVRVGKELHLHRRISAGRDAQAAPVYLDSRG